MERDQILSFPDVYKRQGLECTMLGPQLRFDADNTIAITGGDLMASLDGQPVPTYRAVAVQAGQTLRFQAPKTGCRAYIACLLYTSCRHWARHAHS